MRLFWRSTVVLAVACGLVALAATMALGTAAPSGEGSRAHAGSAPPGVIASPPAAGAPAAGGSGIGPEPPRAPFSEQTHPSARPAVGSRSTAFALLLTPRTTLGVRGVLRTDLRIVVSARRTGCSGRAVVLGSGSAGRRVRVPLPAPAAGWCAGTYRGLVLLERGPYCPPGPPGSRPTPCPEFASQALDVGRFSFRVR